MAGVLDIGVSSAWAAFSFGDQPVSGAECEAMKGIDKATDAGTAAGRRWAKASRNSARLERLREWWTRRRVIDHVDRFAIYATCLTDRFMVAGPEDDCPQLYDIPILRAQRLANGYWGRLNGWPRRGLEPQRRFIEGFVRGAAERAMRT